jgi:hypothetical protein
MRAMLAAAARVIRQLSFLEFESSNADRTADAEQTSEVADTSVRSQYRLDSIDSPVAWQHIDFYRRYQFDADFTC